MSTRKLEAEKRREAHHGEAGETPARRYASFVVRGWKPGASRTLEVAHDQSGERVQADSLVEAIGWIQARSIPASIPEAVAPGGAYREGVAAMGAEVAAA